MTKRLFLLEELTDYTAETPELRESEMVADLLDACRSAAALLEASRMDTDISNLFTRETREIYKMIENKIGAAIAKAESKL